jgi:hypothetical protein
VFEFAFNDTNFIGLIIFSVVADELVEFEKKTGPSSSL